MDCRFIPKQTRLSCDKTCVAILVASNVGGLFNQLGSLQLPPTFKHGIISHLTYAAVFLMKTGLQQKIPLLCGSGCSLKRFCSSDKSSSQPLKA